MSEAPKSPFYVEKYIRPFNVPLLAFERVWSAYTELEEEPTVDIVSDLYLGVLKDICGMKKPTQEQVDYLAERILSATKGKSTSDGSPSKPNSDRSFSSEFYKMVAEQEVHDLLIQMCGYDYALATNAYCVMDREDALKILDNYLLRLQHDQQLLLESAVFGAGGDFGKGSKADVEVDLTSNDKNSTAQLKNFF